MENEEGISTKGRDQKRESVQMTSIKKEKTLDE